MLAVRRINEVCQFADRVIFELPFLLLLAILAGLGLELDLPLKTGNRVDDIGDTESRQRIPRQRLQIGRRVPRIGPGRKDEILPHLHVEAERLGVGRSEWGDGL